jgi:alkylhydroperoxidase family enzyme
MARISPLEPDDAPPHVRERYADLVRASQRITNMKRTLAHDAVAYDALLTWYPLRDRAASFLTDREADVFAYAISTENECVLCSTSLRRAFAEAGDDPDALTLTERQRLLVDYGSQLARDPRGVGEELSAALAREFTPPQIVVLTAFGGLMIATNVFNDALRVDLDDGLAAYRPPAATAAAAN